MSAPENPEQLAEYIQTLLLNVKQQYEQMTSRVVDSLEDINKRVDQLEQNVNHLLESVTTDKNPQ